MDTLYHVTFKNRIEDIKKHGILCIKGKEIFSPPIKKHPNSVYAFLTIEDAIKWWKFLENELDNLIEDNGDPVIVEFADDSNKYRFDSHYQMKQDFPSAVYKSGGDYVKPEQIKNVIYNLV